MILNEIKFQSPLTKTYLGSPSIIRLDNGDLLVTHDYFGPGCPRNHENEEHLTSVYRSSDDGKTWTNVTHIANAYWSTLFKHGGAIYLLGTSQQYGSIVIRRSEDGGNTWTHPTDGKSGILFRGGPYREPPNYHCAPVPVIFKDDRLYRAFEDCTPCKWPRGFQSCLISADIDADLLDASNWIMSNKLPFNSSWLPEEWGDLEDFGWLEGNLVEDRHGQLWNILRFNGRPQSSSVWSVWDKACMVKVEATGRSISFDSESGFINFPGGHSKFTIRYDETSGYYFTLSNGNLNSEMPSLRSVLSLYCSRDLRHWQHLTVLLKDDSGIPYEESIRLTGFQYTDWQFDGKDIICSVRTAYDGAHNFHDANRITFHKIENFRDLLCASHIH